MNKKAIFLYGGAKFAGMKHTLKAINLAHILHAGQFRDDGTEYVEHAVGVAHLLAAHGIRDDVIIAAAILHDTIEDTDYTYEDILREFNEDIASLVKKLSKREGLSNDDYYRQMADDIRVVLIKSADRTHNVSDMVKAFSTDKMKKYIIETEEKVLPAMKWARKINLEYGDVFVALGEHIKAVLLLAKKVVEMHESS